MKATQFLNDSMVNLLNYRIEQEEYSSRIYLSMAMWLANSGFIGAGKLFRKYSDEELLHAEKAREVLLANGLQPATKALPEPKQEFASFPELIKESFAHEQQITEQCNELTKEAFKHNCFMVMELGLWYVKEQVEELDKFQNFIDRLEAFGEEADLLRELDDQMNDLANA